MTFLELAQKRRSVRKFENKAVEPEKIERLLNIASLAAKAFKAKDSGLIIVDEPEKTSSLKAAIVSGWQGKINPWIYVTRFPAVIVLLGKHPGDHPHRNSLLYLPPSAMIMETVVMAAAEMDLGTCWMAGFNADAVVKELALPPPWRPIVVSPLGYPTKKGKLEMVSRTVAQSDRRKSIQEIFTIRESAG